MKRVTIKWYALMASQWGILLTISAAAIILALQIPETYAGYAVVMWVGLPLAGAWTAFYVTVKGLSYYGAWIAPPVCMTAAHWILTGFPPPSAGMPMVAAALSMVAASTAEVARERTRKKK